MNKQQKIYSNPQHQPHSSRDAFNNVPFSSKGSDTNSNLVYFTSYIDNRGRKVPWIGVFEISHLTPCPAHLSGFMVIGLC